MNTGTVRERYVAIVTDNEDEEKRGRIKVACADLMGVDDEGVSIEYPVWIEPSFPHLAVGVDSEGEGVADSGFFFVPNVGTAVEIEITVSSRADQSPGQSSIGNPDPRWVTCLLLPGDAVSSDFTTNYPNRLGWRSRKGSLLMFDDTPGEEVAVVRGPANDDGEHSYLGFAHDGTLIIETHIGHLIHMKDDGDFVIVDGHDNVYTGSSDGVEIVTDAGSVLTVHETITIAAAGNVTVTADTCALEASSVKLGASAAESIIKGNTFQSLFNLHTHNFVGNMGVPGVTLPPLVPLSGSELSTVVTTE